MFAQAVTIVLAAVFVVSSLRPDWLPGHLASAPATGPIHTRDAPRDAAILSYDEAARRATPSVVNVVTTKSAGGTREHPPIDDPLLRRFFGDNFGQRQPSSSLGSGVIVSVDGLILTNHHVVEAAEEIEVVMSDGRRAQAKVVGSDPETDLAVVRVALKDMPAITFGDDKSARVGDVVLAIGNPFGVGQTVTMGIVSALGRNQLGINTFENFIQTDAAINPGNSGGALVDTAGRLLGINSAIYSRTGGSLGIGFAIPVSTARMVMEQIVTSGSVTRGYIGVEPQDITPELAEAFKLPRRDGAIIAGVMRGGPAEKSGVRVGDILVSVEGNPVPNVAAMLNLIARLQPGASARFQFLRDGQDVAMSIVVGKRPRQQPRPE